MIMWGGHMIKSVSKVLLPHIQPGVISINRHVFYAVENTLS